MPKRDWIWDSPEARRTRELERQAWDAEDRAEAERLARTRVAGYEHDPCLNPRPDLEDDLWPFGRDGWGQGE